MSEIIEGRFAIAEKIEDPRYEIIDTDDGANTPVAYCATRADAEFCARLMNAGILLRNAMRLTSIVEQGEALAKLWQTEQG